MNALQEAKLNMYHAVINHCDANPAIVATVPAFLPLLCAGLCCFPGTPAKTEAKNKTFNKASLYVKENFVVS